jgi:hypothetical protein
LPAPIIVTEAPIAGEAATICSAGRSGSVVRRNNSKSVYCVKPVPDGFCNCVPEPATGVYATPPKVTSPTPTWASVSTNPSPKYTALAEPR